MPPSESPIEPFVKPFRETALHLPKSVYEGAKETAQNVVTLPLRVAGNIVRISARTAALIALNIPLLPAPQANLASLGQRVSEVRNRARVGALFERAPSQVQSHTREAIQEILAA